MPRASRSTWTPTGSSWSRSIKEAGEIVVQHLSNDGFLLHEYRSKHAERIQHELARDCALSDINHALYLGRQLAEAETSLKS